MSSVAVAITYGPLLFPGSIRGLFGPGFGPGFGGLDSGPRSCGLLLLCLGCCLLESLMIGLGFVGVGLFVGSGTGVSFGLLDGRVSARELARSPGIDVGVNAGVVLEVGRPLGLWKKKKIEL